MSDAVLRATIKAYDEFTQQFQKFQTELKRTDQTQKQTAQGADQLNRSTSSFFQTIGQLGALYAFQSGLRDVMGTGREFELAIKQSQAVVNDFSSTLRDAAMASRGIQGPTEVAKAFYELGSAGLSAQESIKATPDILDFATAGLLKMEDAAYAVSSTVKSFGLDWSKTTEVVDAFTQAMNSTAMKAEDFRWAMATVGAVGKMAGQDFREVVAAIAAMRDAGVRAEDAGTSVKSALLQLINPTKEAKDVMKALGIEVYDSSGKMKQWHVIIAELERALAPFNDQGRNLILTTIAGTDGVRALATGLNMGSARLSGYVTAMSSADGATKKMADTMTDSFDGSLRKVNANLERAKVLLFEDFAQGAVGALQTLNTLIIGFNSLDEGTRKSIELFVGTMGLVTALGLVASIIRSAVIPALRAMGITASASLGPWGLLIAGVTTLTGLFLTAQVAEAGARVEMEQHNRTIVSTGESYLKLNDKLVGLRTNAQEYRTVQGQANNALQELARVMPEVISQWDAEGRAIEVNNEKLREKIKLSREAAKTSAQESAVSFQETYDTAKQRVEDYNQQIADLQSGKAKVPRASYELHLSEKVLAEEEIRKLTEKRDKAIIERDKAQGEANKQYAILYGGMVASDVGVGRPNIPRTIRDIADEADGAGTQTFTLPEKGKKPKTPEDIAKEQFEASRKWIDYKKALNQLSAEEEIAAWARVSTRYAEDTDERMQADMEVYRAKQRLVDEDQKRYDDAYSQAMDLMRHEVNMARMSTEQQISYLERLREAHAWTQQQMRDIEANLYRLRKQQLSEYLSKLDEEYKDKLDVIDERTKASVKAIQDQIDALESEGRDSDREEAARKHNDKLKDLEEKRRYHELRTGTEHQKAIADIDKEIAEEQRDFQKQQGDWTRDDKKEALQKQIDDARKAGDEERKQLEDHYRRARKIAEGGIMDVIASLAATGPEWLQTGKDLIDQLIAGLQSGDFSGVEAKISQIKGQVPASGATPNVPGSSGGSSKPPSQMSWQELLVHFKTHVSEALAEIARAGAVYTTKLAAGDIEGARAAHKWADQIRKAIGQPMVWDENTESSPDVHNSYAKGGPIFYDQIAKLHAGEYVIPANLVDAIRRSTVPPATMGGAGGDTSSLDRAVDRIVAAIESRMGVKIENLLKIESFNNEDGTDIDVLMGDVRRAVFALAR